MLFIAVPPFEVRLLFIYGNTWLSINFFIVESSLTVLPFDAYILHPLRGSVQYELFSVVLAFASSNAILYSLEVVVQPDASFFIFLLANTIDINSIYFSELCIDEIVSIMNIGDSDIIETPMGTRVYVEFIEPHLDEEKKKAKSKHNQLFFGFPNKKLNSIKGGEWATASYQHIPINKSELLSPIAHLYFNKKLLQIEIHQNENIGICAYIHPSSTLYNDSRIYTATDIIDKRYIYKFGYSKFDKFLFQ